MAWNLQWSNNKHYILINVIFTEIRNTNKLIHSIIIQGNSLGSIGDKANML